MGGQGVKRTACIRRLVVGIILVLVLVSISSAIIASVSPQDFWFLPGQTKDFSMTVKNNYTQTINASVYIKSINTSFLLINGTKMLKIEIINWGSGEEHAVPFNITVLNTTLLGERDEFEIAVFNDTSGDEILREYYTVENVFPEKLDYKLTASKTNASSLDIKIIMQDSKTSDDLGENKTKQVFRSWAVVTDSTGNVLAENSSNGLDLELNLSNLIGEYNLNYGVNYTNNSRYNLEANDKILLLYTLNFTNVSATYLGPVNAYYNLTGPIKGGTLLCVQGYVKYDNKIPLDAYEYNLSLSLANYSTKLTAYDAHFSKCFNAPETSGNYSIKISASGKLGLTATYNIPVEVNNLVNYKPNGTDLIATKISGKIEGNTLIITNKNPFQMYGEIYLEELSKYKHFNFSNMNGKHVLLKPNGNTSLYLNMSFPAHTPPGDYKFVVTIKTVIGNISFPVIYKVETETMPNTVAFNRYYEVEGNNTKVVIYITNTYNNKVSGTIKETIPKSVVRSLGFLEPDNKTKALARECSKENDTIGCIRDVALSTGDCGICTTDACWSLCIQERVDSNKTFNKTYPVIFFTRPRVIESDPVVQWGVNISANSHAQIEYLILGEVVNASKFPKLSGNFRVVQERNEEQNETGTEENQTTTTNGTQVVYTPEGGGADWLVWVAVLIVIIGIAALLWRYKLTNSSKTGKIREHKKESEVPVEKLGGSQKETGTKEVAKNVGGKEKKEASPDDAFKSIGSGFV